MVKLPSMSMRSSAKEGNNKRKRKERRRAFPTVASQQQKKCREDLKREEKRKNSMSAQAGMPFRLFSSGVFLYYSFLFDRICISFLSSFLGSLCILIRFHQSFILFPSFLHLLRGGHRFFDWLHLASLPLLLIRCCSVTF